MKKPLVLILIITFSLSCLSQNDVKTEKRSNAKLDTSSNYLNRLNTYKITPVVSVVKNDTIIFNELRFYSITSAMNTPKLMYDRFGKWDEIIKNENSQGLIFIWRNVKIFKNSEELYTIVTDGVESNKEYFSSIIVLDSTNHDCLTEMSNEKTSIINYFDSAMSNLSSNKKFYYIYKKKYRKYRNK